MSDTLRELVRSDFPHLRELRRDLHRHPELGYEERRTSETVRRELAEAGVEFRAGLARGTGVVGYLPPTTGARGRGAVALRADMDALPIEERTGAPWSSVTAGVMHACGHDGHTATLVGAARALARVRERPSGVLFVFQPAEEGGAGGRAMCEDGALDGSAVGEPARVIFGLHGWPTLPLGVVSTRAGAFLAATDEFRVTVSGRGGHAAYPHAGSDCLLAACACVQALQIVVSRAVDPVEPAVVTVTKVHGGSARNVIPGEAVFEGTVRTLSEGARALCERRFREVVRETARAHGCEASVEWFPGYPALHNEAGAVGSFNEIATRALGAQRVVHAETPTMGGEDFAFYAQRVPACFFKLGLAPEGAGERARLHQAEFDFNDDALPYGVELMCRLALEA